MALPEPLPPHPPPARTSGTNKSKRTSSRKRLRTLRNKLEIRKAKEGRRPKTEVAAEVTRRTAVSSETFRLLTSAATCLPSDFGFSLHHVSRFTHHSHAHRIKSS